MKVIFSLSIMLTAIVMLGLTMPVYGADKMDRRIELSARQSYVFRIYLQGDDIKIQSQNGAVSLTGTVPENFHKSLAQETVSGIPGVKSVDNRLEVKGAPPTANSDAWLKDKVKVALLFHRSVSALKTEVEVKGGIVTLKGNAANLAQKELTTEYAKDVEGVKDVINEMIVTNTLKKARTAGEKIDDASITAQVNMTLLNHGSTSAINTTVRTRRGVVTVAGKAKNPSEKNLVTKLVTDINGVKNVINWMIIE